MRILLTNDDGILGHGLKVLEKIARQLSDDVWIVAPEMDQSGSSHSLTLRDPLRIRHISDKKYAVSGTPTDCVMVGVSHICADKRPNLILSGVNYGGNIADDITYSGTIAAAIEGTLMEIPSIALSLVVDYNHHNAKWATVEHHALTIIQKILSMSVPSNVLMNVNFPDVMATSVKGIQITRQGRRMVSENLIECTDPRGKKYFWIGLGNHGYQPKPEIGAIENAHIPSDLKSVMDGYISITPLSLDLTHIPTIEKLIGAFSL